MKQHFSEEDAAGKVIVMEDLVGKPLEEAKAWLKQMGLTPVIRGTGETVQTQLPAAGQSICGTGQVLLYLEEQPQTQTAEVPDFIGLNRKEAAELALNTGLNILVAGNDSLSVSVTATAQSYAAGTQVPLGTMIRLDFADTGAHD